VQKLDFWEVWTFPQIAHVIGISLLFITAFAAVMGSLFGSQTSRGLVKRFDQPLTATQAWSRGDFSVHAEDTSPDELGALARGLNQMAAQLENLLEERQERSIIGERVRLARDLHDSIKQQAFGASAQLAAAQAHFKNNPAEAQTHLTETDHLLDSMRQELAALIHELRPPALQGRGLAKALRAYAQDCANQSGVDIDVSVQGERWLPLETEQALYRIAQGALSNVVRHSQATLAEVKLIYDEQTVTLSVADNGCGFNAVERRSGLGMRLMRERAQMLRGNLLIRSEPGAGTIVRLKCGIEQAASTVGRG
jgi:signal transduction histidine kinase